MSILSAYNCSRGYYCACFIIRFIVILLQKLDLDSMYCVMIQLDEKASPLASKLMRLRLAL